MLTKRKHYCAFTLHWLLRTSFTAVVQLTLMLLHSLWEKHISSAAWTFRSKMTT